VLMAGIPDGHMDVLLCVCACACVADLFADNSLLFGFLAIPELATRLRKWLRYQCWCLFGSAVCWEFGKGGCFWLVVVGLES
jgi:hypothetical protein